MIQSQSNLDLPKLQNFTNLDVPDLFEGFQFQKATFLGGEIGLRSARDLKFDPLDGFAGLS